MELATLATVSTLVVELLSLTFGLGTAIGEIASIDDATQGFADEVAAFRMILIVLETKVKQIETDGASRRPPWWNELKSILSEATAICSKFQAIVKDIRRRRSTLSNIRQYWSSKSYDAEVKEIRHLISVYTHTLSFIVGDAGQEQRVARLEIAIEALSRHFLSLPKDKRALTEGTIGPTSEVSVIAQRINTATVSSGPGNAGRNERISRADANKHVPLATGVKHARDDDHGEAQKRRQISQPPSSPFKPVAPSKCAGPAALVQSLNRFGLSIQADWLDQAATTDDVCESLRKVEKYIKTGCYALACPLLKKVIVQIQLSPRLLSQEWSMLNLQIWLGMSLVYEHQDLPYAETMLRGLLAQEQLLTRQRAQVAYLIACILVCRHTTETLQEAKRICQIAAATKVSNLMLYTGTTNLPAVKLVEICSLLNDPDWKLWQSISSGSLPPKDETLPTQSTPSLIWQTKTRSSRSSCVHFFCGSGHMFAGLMFGLSPVSADQTSVTLRYINSGAVRRVLTNPDQQSAVAFSPDGGTLVVVKRVYSPFTQPQLKLSLIDVPSKDVRQTGYRSLDSTLAAQDLVPCVAYGPDGKTFAFGIGGLELVNAQTGVTIATMDFDTRYKGYHLTHMVFSPDGKMIAVSVQQKGKRSGVGLLCAKTLNFLRTIHNDSKIYGSAFSPDSRSMAIYGSTKILLRNVETRALIADAATEPPSCDKQRIIFSSAGDQLLHIGCGNIVIRWTKNLTLNRNVDVQGDPCHLALSEDGQFLAVSMNDGTLKMYKIT